MKKFYFLIIIFWVSVNLFSQGTYMPLDAETYNYIDRLDIKYGRILPIPHSSSRPFLRSDIGKMVEALKTSNVKIDKRSNDELQYLLDDNAEWLDSIKSINKKPIWLFKKGSKAALYKEPASFAKVSIKDFDLRINPVIAFRLGGESSSTGLRMVNTRGIELRLNIKKIVSGYFYLTDNQTRNADYVASKYDVQLRQNADALNPIVAVANNGYYKEYAPKVFKVKNGVDYFDARGYININALKYFNITLGHDKNFIGNGVRSLFLSDNAAPYFFLKLNTRVWKLNYQNIFCELNNQYIRGGDQLLPKKYAAFHHLDIDISKGFNIGFFEGIIFNRSNHFELQYLNPLIFYNSIEKSLGSPDNSVLGLDFKANAFGHLRLYGQLLLDDLNVFRKNGYWGNKYAIQVGARYIDIVPHLDAQVEFNIARPYTYGHNEENLNGTIINPNYTHYNQALAHPLGANFAELITILRYQPSKKFYLQMKYIFAAYGKDSLLYNVDGTVRDVTNYGGNIFANNAGNITNAAGIISPTGHSQGEGVKTTLSYLQLRAYYMIWHNVYVDAELVSRAEHSALKAYSNSTFFVSLGLRMNIAYKSYDF